MVDMIEKVVGFSVAKGYLKILKRYFEQYAITHQEHSMTPKSNFILWLEKFPSYYYRLIILMSLVGRILQITTIKIN